ncbi:phage tail tape measure protein [Nocardia niigatensis]
MADQQIIGYAALQVIPTLAGLEGNLGSQLQGPLVAAGRSAGQATGRAIADGVEAAAAAVERASETLKTAREKDADAAGKVRVAEEKLAELRDKGTATAAQIARAEEAVATAQRNADRQARATQRAVQDLSDARANAANATNQATESEGRFHGALGKLSEKIDPAVGKMAGLAAATAGVGSAMELASDAMANDKLNDKLAAQLGATPAMAQEFGHIAGQLYANAYGEDLSQINDALKNVWQQGLVGEDANDEEIKKVTASVLDLATAFDQDVSGATAAVGTMLKTGLAPDAQSAMDILTRGFQQGADKGQDLLDTFVEYPTLFRALGLSGEESMGLLAQATADGARNADQVADALKEFQLRSVDGSKTTGDAYKALGLDADQMFAQMAAGGDSAKSGLNTVLDRLRAMDDPLARNAAAVGLFGTKAEDMAQALYAMDPSKAVAELGDVAGATERLGEVMSDNTATSIEKFKRGIHEAMVEKMGEAIHWIEENKNTAMIFAGVLGTVAGAIAAVKIATVAWNTAQTIAAGATKAWTAVQWLWNAAMSANPIGIVVVAIAALVAAIVLAWQHSETFRNVVIGAWDAIKTGALWLWDNALKPFFSWLGDIFTTIGAAAVWLWDNGIKPAFDGIGAGAQLLWSDFLSPVFTDIKILIGLVGDAISWLWNTAAQPALDALGTALSWLWDTIAQPALDAMKTGVQALGDVVTWLWNTAVQPAFDGIGSAIDTVWKNVVSPAFDAMKSGIGLVGDAFGLAGNAIKAVWNTVLDVLRPVAHAIGNALAAIPDKIGPFEVPGANTAHSLGQTLQAFRSGGPVSGPGTGTSDSILAFVSNGEFIEPADAVTPTTLPLLEAIRSGWVPSPQFLQAMVGEVPGYAGGGVVAGLSAARKLDPASYRMGGFSLSELDCSGLVSAVVNDALGAEMFSSRMATATERDWLVARGALEGLGGPGDISIGWYNGGPGGGHTAMTLGDGTNVESNSSDGVVVGGPVGAAAQMFTDHMHIPAALLRGSDLGGGTGGGLGTGTGGTGGGAGGGSGTGAGGGTGGGSSTATRPAGTATPVWVDNWPSSFGTSTPSSSTPVGGQNVDTAHNTPATQDNPGTSTPQADTTTNEYKARDHPLKGAPLTGELFNGDAPWWWNVSSPQEAATNLAGQAANQWGKTQSDVQTWFQDSWKEMLSTGAAVLGMGAVGGGGGDTYNFNGMDPNSAATAVARVQRRRTLAMQRQGGIGR